MIIFYVKEPYQKEHSQNIFYGTSSFKKNLQHEHNNYQKRNIKTAQDPLGSEGKVSRCRICD